MPTTALISYEMELLMATSNPRPMAETFIASSTSKSPLATGSKYRSNAPISLKIKTIGFIPSRV